MRTHTSRALAAVGAALAIGASIVLSVLPASAHVTIPDPGTKGGFSIVTFSVPNEREESTVEVEVKLPEDAPLPFVSVQPKPGWTVETTKRTLDEPVEAFGESYDEVVDTVTWSGGTIEDGQFDTFSLSVGPLPDDVDSLAFPTIQTYDGGEEVSWIDAPAADGAESEHPAPTLALVDGAAEGDHHDSDSGDAGDDDTTTTVAVTSEDGSSGTLAKADEGDDGTDGVAIAALVVGIVAVLLAGGAFLTARRNAA